jgi:predicted membrane chloride channel (bestrophin family)
MSQKKSKYISPSQANKIIACAVMKIAILFEVGTILNKYELPKKLKSKVLHTLKDQLLKISNAQAKKNKT